MDRWCGKVAMVTGASAGIGAAICKELVQHGMTVVGLARRDHQIQELALQLRNCKGQLHAFKCDMQEEDNIFEAFKWTIQNFGPVCVLINNAGIIVPSTLRDGVTEDWRKVFDINVLALCVCTREALKQMEEKHVNDGHIIHINSITGHYVPMLANTTLNVYPASKFAVTALTEVLRQEMMNHPKKQVKVTSISPGLVRTEWLDGLIPDTKTALSGPLQPILEAENVAQAVVFALSTPPTVEISDIVIRPFGEPY